MVSPDLAVKSGGVSGAAFTTCLLTPPPQHYLEPTIIRNPDELGSTSGTGYAEEALILHEDDVNIDVRSVLSLFVFGRKTKRDRGACRCGALSLPRWGDWMNRKR